MRAVFSVKDKLNGLLGRETLEQQVENAKADIFRAEEFKQTQQTPGYRNITRIIEEMETEVNRSLENQNISDKDLRLANVKKSVIADFKGRLLLISTRGNEARTKLNRIEESNNGR